MSLSVRGEETILDLAALNRNIGKARVVYDSEGGERERVDLARAKRRKKEEEENALKEPHPLHVHDDTTMSFGAAAVRNEVTHDHEPMSLETDPVLSASESDLNKLYAMRLRQHHIAEIGGMCLDEKPLNFAFSRIITSTHFSLFPLSLSLLLQKFPKPT